MNDLSNTIYRHYIDHFNELPLDKKVHFAARLFVWRQDPQCRLLLQDLREELMPTGNVTDSLRMIRKGRLFPLRYGSQVTQSLRQPYFERYPTLRSTAGVLYWACLFDTVYGTNAREGLHEIFPPHKLQNLYESLQQDTRAIAVLSTYAVNFMHLYQYYYHSADTAMDPLYFLDIAQQDIYNFTDPPQVQLAVYLLTHCIIAESHFYGRPLPPAAVKPYTALLTFLEKTIGNHQAELNLDSQLEFLICCVLLNRDSSLRQSILKRAEQSISDDGSYIIDPSVGYTSLEKSEHRNVLYLMNNFARGS
jgi:hypothetical protein